LYDKDNAFARQLDLVHGFPQELQDIYQGTFSIDVGGSNGTTIWELPMPSRFVINTDHKVKAQEVNASYTNRMPTDEAVTLNSRLPSWLGSPACRFISRFG